MPFLANPPFRDRTVRRQTHPLLKLLLSHLRSHPSYGLAYSPDPPLPRRAPTAGSEQAGLNGASGLAAANALGSGFARANTSSIAEAIQAYQVGGAEKLAFLEPRGLVNYRKYVLYEFGENNRHTADEMSLLATPPQ